MSVGQGILTGGMERWVRPLPETSVKRDPCYVKLEVLSPSKTRSFLSWKDSKPFKFGANEDIHSQTILQQGGQDCGQGLSSINGGTGQLTGRAGGGKEGFFLNHRGRRTRSHHRKSRRGSNYTRGSIQSQRLAGDPQRRFPGIG